MIYVLHDCSESAGTPRTASEALELLDLPWPVNPYHLAAAVDCHLIQSAYVLTQTGEPPSPGLVAHDLTRSTQVGDLVIDADGQVFLLGPDQSGENLLYVKVPLLLFVDLPDSYYNQRNRADLSRYRIGYRRVLR